MEENIEKLENEIKERREELRVEKYKSKNMQSEHCKGFDLESHQWLKCNKDARKVSVIINSTVIQNAKLKEENTKYRKNKIWS